MNIRHKNSQLNTCNSNSKHIKKMETKLASFQGLGLNICKTMDVVYLSHKQTQG